MTKNELTDVKLHLVDSSEKAHEFIRWLGDRRPHNAIALDIETGEIAGFPRKDALSAWHGKIRLVQIGDAHQGWAIPWEEWSGVFYEAMKNFSGPIVFHNIAFEARWFAIQSRWKIPWERVHDTMIMAHLIDPLGSGALKTLSSKYIDHRSAVLQENLASLLAKNGWTWGTVPISYEPFWSYGAMDPVITMRLWDIFYQQCGPGGPYETVYSMEMSVRKIVTQMEINGVKVDLKYSQEKRDELIEFSEKAKIWAYNKYNVKITSNKQLTRLLEKLGASLTERTDSGELSASADQMKKLIIEGNEEVKHLADIVLQQRRSDKLAITYFQNFIDRAIDGLLHTSVKTLGARTGRMAMSDPALQTLPAGEAIVRQAFIPKDDDHVILTSDLDQVEFRITASFSEDPQLIDLFRNADGSGGDPFTLIMRDIYNDPSAQKSDPRRRLVKGTVYGKLYGAGIPKMALTAGVSEGQMREVVDAFDLSYPGVKNLQKQIENIGMKRLRNEGQGYVLTRMGRRLPCDPDRVYSLMNYLVQSSAAEVFKMNMIKLDKADLSSMLLLPVHDEIILQAPKKDIKEVSRTVKDCMTTIDSWPVPLTCGVDGPFGTWGDKYL